MTGCDGNDPTDLSASTDGLTSMDGELNGSPVPIDAANQDRPRTGIEKLAALNDPALDA